MEQKKPAWHHACAILAAGLAVLVLGEWLLHLQRWTPPISRSDHLLAIWRISGAIEEGAWARVVAWVFEFSGGHIIAYARALQLLNYTLFDYSGRFIQVAAIASFAAVWVAAAWAVVRTVGWGIPAGVMLLWTALLVANPVFANLVMWPEGAPAFLLTTVVASLLVPWLGRGSLASAVTGGLAVAFTNGSGFAFLPAALLPRMRRRWIAAGVLLAAGFLFLLPRLIRMVGSARVAEAFPAMDLGIVVHSLGRFALYPGLFAKYCFAALALPFAPFPIDSAWPLGLAVAAYTAAVLWLVPREPGPHRGWVVLACFGVLCMLALALGRFGYVDSERGGSSVITSHYGAVVLPLMVALGPLTWFAARGRRAPLRVALAACAVALAGALLWKRAAVERDFSYPYATEMAAQFGSSNWNIFSAALTLGSTNVGQIAVLRVFPELKARGKYPELTRSLVVDPSSLGIDKAVRNAATPCGEVVSFGPDERYPWAVELPTWSHMYSPRIVPFVRAVGRATCDAEFLVMFGRDGRPQCVARPSPLALRFTEPALQQRLAGAPRPFDFSCPGGDATSVWAFDARRGVLLPLASAPK